MDNENKEIDKKLYRVARKKGSHINTKENSDGSKSAIQFSDDSNNLTGPVDLIEVNEDELIRTEYIEVEPLPQTFKEIVMEDVVAPIVREALEQALDIGASYFEEWLNTTVVPKTKEKTKELGKNIQLIFSAVKDGVLGKETKAEQILRKQKADSATELAVHAKSSVKQGQRPTKKKTFEKEIHSKKEVQEVVNIMRSSAITMAACIRWLNNAAVKDDGTDAEKRLEIQRNLEELSSEDVLRQIDLLLEEKNRNLLDQASLKMIAAFREGKFLINEELVPISNYISENGNVNN